MADTPSSIARADLNAALEDSSSGEHVENALFATASHEIRTPLNGILGMVSLLLETELQPAQRDYAEAIQLSGSRLLGMLNNVLDYARLDAGDLDLEISRFSPIDLAREVVELLAPRAHAGNIDIAVRNLLRGQAMATGDAGRIRQILFNLVGNALKFTDTGGVLVDVRHRDGRLIWSIIDTGPGITEDDQAGLFEAFQQTSAMDAQKDGGVGLGLAIVQRLAKALGGEILLDSTPGLGSAFRFSLPVELERSPSTSQNEFVQSDARRRVTLVDLPKQTTLAAVSALELAGHAPIIAEPSAEIDRDGIILADAQLPIQEVARLASLAPTLIVLRPEDRSTITRYRLLGCAGWLVRPLRESSLVERVRLAHMGERNLGDETRREQLKGARILIADDNAINILIAQRALEQAGYFVSTAVSGVEAIESAETMDFALILMDLRMPVMDGFEAMRKLRAGGHKTPIIAVSAEINPQIEQQALEAGANAVAAKPLDAAALRELTETWAKLPDKRDVA